MRTRSRKGLVKSLDDLTRTLLRLKQENTCEYCGLYVEGRNSQVHHIRSRKYYETRWDLRNMVLLCASCHRDWFRERYPECAEWIDEVRKTPPETYRNTDLLAIEQDLKRQIKEMENA